MTIVHEIKKSIVQNIKYIRLRDSQTQIKLITPFIQRFKGNLQLQFSLIFLQI